MEKMNQESTQGIKRSDLWKEIYNIVSQIPRNNVIGDAMDYNSASTEIELLMKVKSTNSK